MASVAEEEAMSVKRQCELLEVSRSSFYHCGVVAVDNKAEDELLILEMDKIYLEEPIYGSRRLLDQLKLMAWLAGLINICSQFVELAGDVRHDPSQLGFRFGAGLLGCRLSCGGLTPGTAYGSLNV